jgi:hypothetical protein
VIIGQERVGACVEGIVGAKTLQQAIEVGVHSSRFDPAPDMQGPFDRERLRGFVAASTRPSDGQRKPVSSIATRCAEFSLGTGLHHRTNGARPERAFRTAGSPPTSGAPTARHGPIAMPWPPCAGFGETPSPASGRRRSITASAVPRGWQDGFWRRLCATLDKTPSQASHGADGVSGGTLH